MSTSPKRKVHDRREAEALLAAWRASGLSFIKFCNREKVDGRSLQCWRINVARAATDAPIQLVELAPMKADTSVTYRVRLGDVVIEVDDAFRDDTLSRLLAVVAAC